jgi:fido (protein-threonine AMPylation protein)
MTDGLISSYDEPEGPPKQPQAARETTGQEETSARVARSGKARIAPVPENNLDTKDPVFLQMAEDVAGGVRAHEIRIGDAYIPGNFDAEHLRNIHTYVMQDIYAEPGATRGDERLLAEADLKNKPEAKLPLEYDTREGAHGQLITLVPAGKVNQRLEDIGARLARENYLGVLDKPEFVARLADYHLEYNKVAPFQSGNEHVLNVVLNQIGEEAGYVVAPSAAKHLREVTDATLDAGMTSDKSRLIQVLSSVTVEGEGEEAQLRRRATQWALPAETTAEREKRVKEEYGG